MQIGVTVFTRCNACMHSTIFLENKYVIRLSSNLDLNVLAKFLVRPLRFWFFGKKKIYMVPKQRSVCVCFFLLFMIALKDCIFFMGFECELECGYADLVRRWIVMRNITCCYSCTIRVYCNINLSYPVATHRHESS